jgi:hypothetical protein
MDGLRRERTIDRSSARPRAAEDGTPRGRNRPELLQQGKVIRLGPALDDLPAGDAEHVDGVEAHRLAGRRDAHELAHVGAARRHAPHHFVAFGNQVFDLNLQIGEGGVQQREDLLDPFKAVGNARGQGMVDLVRGNDLLDAVQLVLTDDLAPTTEQGLVIFGGHAHVPFCGQSQMKFRT